MSPAEARAAAISLRGAAIVWARSYVGAAAEDVAHDAIVELLAKQAGIDYRAAAAWLRTTVLHKAREHMRRQKERLGPAPDIACDVTPEDTLACAQLGAAVQAALARVPEHRRGPLVEVHAEGRSQADVAAEQGVPESTVRVRARDGAEELRADLHRQRVAEKRRSGSTSWFVMLGVQDVRRLGRKVLTALGAIIAGGLLLIPEDIETLGPTSIEAPARVAIVEPLTQPVTARAERGVDHPTAPTLLGSRARHDAGRRWRGERW